MNRRRIVLASSNAGKLAEIAKLLDGLPIELISQSTLDIPPAAETASTFVENALLKARAAAQASGLPAIADDSGLEVDALDGAPGIHSARYAGRHGDDQGNIDKLLRELSARTDALRSARFRCVAVYLAHADHSAPLIGEGAWEGIIAPSPSGVGGFGYDPVFYLPERELTAAELASDEKNRLSHRAQAFTQLRLQLASNFSLC